jgi:hypothetical protein
MLNFARRLHFSRRGCLRVLSAVFPLAHRAILRAHDANAGGGIGDVSSLFWTEGELSNTGLTVSVVLSKNPNFGLRKFASSETRYRRHDRSVQIDCAVVAMTKNKKLRIVAEPVIRPGFVPIPVERKSAIPGWGEPSPRRFRSFNQPSLNAKGSWTHEPGAPPVVLPSPLVQRS